MKNISHILLVVFILLGLQPNAFAKEVLQYKTCFSATEDPVCFIAFEKLQSIINPITKERYYHNGLHIVEGKVFRYPMFYVATTDLDGDGKSEIIASVQEETDEIAGQFCPQTDICPHYIIQDRTLPDQNRTVNSLKAIGPIFAYAIAPSTDERFDNFLSLRAYPDNSWQTFDVYQYDGDEDQYFNMSVGP
ncbi:MAG: hypothetical protein AAF549_06045 [Pseudomonadota bacterium]